MAYVSTRCSERKETIGFCVSVIWSEVEVNPVLRRLSLGHRDEEEAGQSIRSRSNLELVWFVVHDNPSQRLLPPAAQRARVACIDDRLLPNEAHRSIVGAASPSRALRQLAPGRGMVVRTRPFRAEKWLRNLVRGVAVFVGVG